MQRLTEALEEYFTSSEVEAMRGGPMEAKTMAVNVAGFLAKRFNRSTLYLGIHADKEERNRKIIHLRETKKLTFDQIARTLGVSASTVHSVVMNKDTVTINGEFG